MLVDLIALDGDDTLWHDGVVWTVARDRFRTLVQRYSNGALVDSKLDEIEVGNLAHFGYGVKGFVLSMIETAIEVSKGAVTGLEVQQMIDLGREMLARPVQLLEGVRETIERLASVYPLILLTKGDLLDQETKLARSGLGDFFSAVEVVTEKNQETYARVMRRHRVPPSRFLMVGNSLRFDVLPVVAAGGHAVYVPSESTWAHERLPDEPSETTYARIDRFGDLPRWLKAAGLSA
jgi:putative hydrolase of the HAD superfamily